MIIPMNIQPEALPNSKIQCGNCGTDLVFNDRYDVTYSALSNGNKDNDWVVYGYVECPICGFEVIVEMDGEWLAEEYTVPDDVTEG